MNRWRLVSALTILPVTVTAIGFELWYGLDNNPNTLPWTYWLAHYVPWPIQLIAYVALAVWLPVHFWRHDHIRQVAFTRGRRCGVQAGRLQMTPTAEDLARRFHEEYETLAPAYGYRTRKESAKPWGDVPSQNKRLMIATAAHVILWLGNGG